MSDLKRLDFHDDIIRNVTANYAQRSILIELDHVIDMALDGNKVTSMDYMRALLTLLECQKIFFDIYGDKNKEVILTTKITEGSNSTDGLIHIELYTTSNSTIRVSCNDFSLEKLA